MASAKTLTAVIKLAGKVDGSLLKSFASTEKRMSAMKKVGAAAIGGVAAATAAAVKGAGQCADKAASYQKQYAKVKTLLADGTDTEVYSKNILKTSTATGIATDQLNETVYQAISASVDQGKAVEFAATAAKLAKGGFTDSATAVDVLTTALNAYGEQSGLTEESVSDMLITTQNLGKTSVNELAGSIGKVIPIARSYNTDLQNVAASYAVLTKNGIKTRNATTYLNSMLSELGDSGSGVSKVLKDKTGKNFAELQGEGKSLYDVLGILSDSVNGNSTAFQDLWAKQNAGTAATSLLNAGSKEYARTLKAMERSTGATAKAAGTMGDTYDSAKAKMANAVENTKTAIGLKLIPVMTQVSQEVMPRVQQMASDLIDKLDGVDLGQVADDAARLAGTVFDNVTGFVSTVAEHKSEIAGVAITLGVIAGAIAAVSAVSGAITAVQTIAGAAGAAGAGLSAAAAGEAAAGAAAAVSAPQILAMGAAVLLVGGGVALACAGLYGLSQAAVSIVASGPGAAAAMAALVAGLALLAAGAMAAGPALTAGAVGMAAFGAAVAMAGAGTALACSGLALLATQMPTIAQFGPSAALAISMIASSSVAAAPGIGVLAAACAPAAVAMATFALASSPAAAAMSSFGWGVQAANQSIWPLRDGLNASQGAFSLWSASVGEQSSAASARVLAAMASMRAAVEGCRLTVPTIRVQALPHFRMSGSFDPKSGSVPAVGVDYYARGGFTNGLSIAGEAGQEAVISFDPRYRSSNIAYWARAGQMLGVATYGAESPLARELSGGSTLSRAAAGSASAGGVNLGGVTFAPVLNVTGDAGNDVLAQIRAAGEEFFDMLDDWADRREADYAPAF